MKNVHTSHRHSIDLARLINLAAVRGWRTMYWEDADLD